MTEFAPCTLHQVSDHVWWFTPESRTDRPSLGLVAGEAHTLMLDVGASPAHTQQFLQAIADANLPKPSFAVLTHWHWDHCFGMAAVDVPIMAHRLTAQHIERMSGYNYGDAGLAELVNQGIENAFIRDHMVIELTDEQRQNLQLRQPDTLIEDTYTYDLGAVTCEVKYVGGDHAEDSCVMYIPQDKVLLMGDCFYYTVYTEPRHYTAKVLDVMNQLEAFGAEKFIEGHSDEIITAAQIKRWFAITRDAFALIKTHGIDDVALLQRELSDKHGEEDVEDFLLPIVEGCKSVGC